MRKIMFYFCLTISLGCCVYAATWMLGGAKQKSSDGELADSFHQGNVNVNNDVEKKIPDEQNIFNELSNINNDIIGWITINGTNVDYPVVQTNNNDYYMKTDFYGNKNAHGAIFMDFTCSNNSTNKIIYGHHMKDGTMFSDLEKYKEQYFLNDHNKIIFYTLDGNEEIYEIVEVWYWDSTQATELPFYEYMDNLSSVYSNSSLISLTTCDFSYDDARMVIIAKKK